MTPEEAAFRGVIYGGAITLVGTFLASCFQILLQWLQQKWGFSADKKKMFVEKRLNALQGVVQLCDFLIAARGHHLGGDAAVAWNRIRNENLSNGALMPKKIQKEFQSILVSMLFHDSFHEEGAAVDIAAAERLRAACLDAIQNEFES
jgi:hypothetical protein